MGSPEEALWANTSAVLSGESIGIFARDNGSPDKGYRSVCPKFIEGEVDPKWFRSGIGPEC